MKFTHLKGNRAKLDVELRNSSMRKYFSPAMLCLYKEIIPRLRTHASGKLLDVGCGNTPFRKFLDNLIVEYHTLDLEPKFPEVNFVADVQDMRMVPSETYDVVLCTEVVEHVPQPAKAISEVHRILKPHGKLILTVPYLSRLHEEPFDYFRYTKHGLQFLLETSGFQILDLAPTGSLFSFLGHNVSTLTVCSLWHVPIVKHFVFCFNALLCTIPCYWLDRIIGIPNKLPLGYVAVAEKDPLRGSSSRNADYWKHSQ